MIISHEHRYVFVEIPHTGSHSIAAELVEYYGGKRILRKHANVTQFLAQASPAEKKYFVFGSVRNPLDTAVTDYSKLESNHRGLYTNPVTLMANGGSVTDEHLRQFRMVHDEGASFADFMRRFHSKIYHNWFLVGSRRYDYILRFENLREDYAKVITMLGLPLARELPHVNSTKKQVKDFDEYYTPDIRDLVIRCYGAFMRHWGYQFPASWGECRVPVAYRLRFEVIETVVALVARFASLDPDNRYVGRAKKLLESVF